MARAFGRIGWFVVVIVAAMSLAGCGLFSGAPKKKIPGERISVLPEDEGAAPDARIASLEVKVPPEVENADWPQPAGFPGQFISNPAVKGFAVAWRTSVGYGNSRDGRVSSQPVVAQGRVYTIDAGSRLTAVDAATGRTVWTFDLEPDEDRSGGGSGGGIAFYQGNLYVATGYAQVIALQASDAKELWRTTLTAPFRAGPAVADGKVFVVSSDNQIYALDAANGHKVWTHAGIAEGAGLYGGAAPVVAANLVLAALSSGEIFALRMDTGRVQWSDSLAGIQKSDAVSALPDIRGFPIVERGQVIVGGHASRLLDIDLRSGARVWEQGFGSFNSPWVAGDFVYLITVDGQLLCMSRRDGRVRWVQQLRRYKDEEEKTGFVTWSGPVLAGSRLFAADSEGDGVVLSPETGEVISKVSLPGAVSVLPTVAGGTIYVLTDDADLVAIR